MTWRRSLAAELHKSVTLPATVVAFAVAVLGQVAISALNALSIRGALAAGQPERVAFTSAWEAGFSAVPLGTIGAVIFGVVAISSEYTASTGDAGGGRQIAVTLTATPGRAAVLTAKAVAVVLLVTATAVVAIPAVLGVAAVIIGDAAPQSASAGDVIGRSAGAALYWVLTGLMALAITVVTRSGIVPLVVLITNGTLISFSFLLSKLTPLARYLPDLAGAGLYAGDTFTAVQDPLDPITGGLVMTAWTVAMLAGAAVVFARRDA